MPRPPQRLQQSMGAKQNTRRTETLRVQVFADGAYASLQRLSLHELFVQLFLANRNSRDTTRSATTKVKVTHMFLYWITTTIINNPSTLHALLYCDAVGYGTLVSPRVDRILGSYVDV